ncbi:MAG: OmpA family protein [Bacteroidales bacterium]|nr:OmpA family protein [Bacteroidales bacterium]
MTKLIFICCFLLFIFRGFAQKNSLDNAYDRALNYFKTGNLAVAKEILKHNLDDDSAHYKSYELLAEIFLSLEQYDSLLYYYRAGVRHCSKKYPEMYFYLGNYEFYLGNISQALEAYNCFIKQVPKSNLVNKVNYQIQRCKYAMELMNNPVTFNPKNLGDGINSNCDEYYPYISSNDSVIIFTRKVPIFKGGNPASDNTQEDFYMSKLTEEGWTQAIPLKGNINTPMNEGAQTVTADGKYMVFTACNRRDGKGSCDLYFSELTADGWTKARNLTEINTMFWESQPSISADGRVLYFASERQGGIGNADIYVSYRQSDGRWSKPQLLDTLINTPLAETSPFIHPDGRTLYFCSNGHMGVGGFDIFVTRLDENGNWTKPKNLGYPINTPKNEIGLVVSSTGTKAYITSSREGGYGLHDLYEFDLPVEAQANTVSYFKGTIKDKETGKPLAVTCEIIDLETNKVVYSVVSDTTDGSFLLGLPLGRMYGMYCSAKGYLFYTENIQLDKQYSKSSALNREISLQKISPGKSIILPNVFYDTDSFRLKPTSFAELDKVITFLQEHPKVKIEISGHTDNTGSDLYNLQLSEKRARSVYQYLLQKNIDATRLTYKGYGSQQPISSNNTMEGRAKNRRTELKIIQ